ncbi:TniQ family protein [Paracoccus albus]|uniref:TniQ family protein n=1 Tax=Paracoccus albus TaxID=3017784 RepID=UPI0022F02EAD|nr:TniQ family protein [Paracoccus albus]WBU60583.1 TniQ family protein [Paracoccus albus]
MTMTILTPKLPFRPEETHLSWATRLSALHGTDSLRPFLTDMGIKPVDLITGRPAAVNRLCEVAGQAPGPVWLNTAMSDGKHSYSLRGETLPVSMILRDETRFCPLCLLEDDEAAGGTKYNRSARLDWSLRVVTTCARHNLRLAPRLRPRGAGELHGIRELVPERGQQLVALADELPRREPSPIQTYVINRLNGETGPAWLDRQSLEQAVKATQMLGIVMTFGAKVMMGRVDSEDLDFAGRNGWKFTSFGEAGVNEALTMLQGNAYRQDIGGQNYATVFGALYNWLREPGERSDHGPIKKLLRNYIINNMDVTVGRELLGKRIERRLKYSAQSLALETGLHRQTLRKVLVNRGLVASEDADKSNSVVLVDTVPGLDAAEALCRAVPFLGLQAYLNASLPVVRTLIDLGLLTPLHRSKTPKGRDKCGFDGREVGALLDRVHSLAPEIQHHDAEWITLTQCTKRARVTMQSVLKLVFDGQIKGIGRCVGETGFKAIRIDLDEIRRLNS